ncbi:NfeD family protein [Oerskovia turbata]|uniref:NfeD family protein n=1 Tax=Oerskovia turbata TaxID=1713 RepID=A0A4Q1KU85_9CELL|nr:NfeD family protein [Oerskovia turbata]RXR23739.1 NfeD family protein [Oerskovia turbata]RXR33791.1 NfeD family protein [Oerskovia turbata]TGJ96798.1 NfeD family protein [Actinotalea fermentans ATCC 43279 = JCM 9966 = DSM 3133]
MDWLWWVGAGLLFVLIEIISLDLVLIMFAGGAFAAAGVNAAGGPLWLQIVTFAVVSAALLLSLRPWLLRHLRQRVPLAETGAAAQVGRTAVVVDRVTELSGRIKLQGEIWSARTVDGSPELPIGAEVRVVRIDGATAVVRSLAADSHTV